MPGSVQGPDSTGGNAKALPKTPQEAPASNAKDILVPMAGGKSYSVQFENVRKDNPGDSVFYADFAGKEGQVCAYKPDTRAINCQNIMTDADALALGLTPKQPPKPGKFIEGENFAEAVQALSTSGLTPESPLQSGEGFTQLNFKKGGIADYNGLVKGGKFVASYTRYPDGTETLEDAKHNTFKRNPETGNIERM